MSKTKKQEIMNKIGKNDMKGKRHYVEYDLPCRYCNYQLPLNEKFIKNIKEYEGEIYILMQCPNCNISNTVLAKEWLGYRKKWNGG
jgi:hypothetical protein